MKNKINYSKWNSFRTFLKGSPKAPFGLIIEFGNKGCGKSTEIAKDELKWEQGHRDFKWYTDFYTNIEINTDNPHYHHLDLLHYQLTDYFDLTEKTKEARIIPYDKKEHCYRVVKTPFKIQEDSIIEIDEIGIIAHARNYKDFPKEFTNLVKYLRKLGILLVMSSQQYDIDKCLRENSDLLKIRRKYFWWSISRRINKKIVINDSKNTNYVYTAEQQIHDELKLAPIFRKKSLTLTFIPFYVNRFDSFK